MYKITIGTDNGTPCIGANAAKGCAVVTKVWPSQLRYRVTARLPSGEVVIVTRTAAREIGATVIAEFPRADHAHARR
jgi:hypothetical protein